MNLQPYFCCAQDSALDSRRTRAGWACGWFDAPPARTGLAAGPWTLHSVFNLSLPPLTSHIVKPVPIAIWHQATTRTSTPQCIYSHPLASRTVNPVLIAIWHQATTSTPHYFLISGFQPRVTPLHRSHCLHLSPVVSSTALRSPKTYGPPICTNLLLYWQFKGSDTAEIVADASMLSTASV